MARGLLVAASLIVVLRVAGADPVAPVNLLRSVPTIVAVSSTVDNAKIKPEHLVDGNPATAWNSRTGELGDAWIAFRVPADTKVTAIKLTAGFTSVDKKLGDLFTQNPRIRKVRVLRAGTSLGDFPLDITNRGLQSIAIDAPGGDFQIRVIAYEPGSKKTWREICVSELEVWGTTATVRKSTPAMRLRSLDAPPPTEDCVKALVPRPKGRIVSRDQREMSATTTLCRVDTAPTKDAIVVTVAAVQRTPRKQIGTPLTIELDVSTSPGFSYPDDPIQHSDTATLVEYPLTAQETGLLVHVNRRAGGNFGGGEHQTSTLYRAVPDGWQPVLSYESKEESSMESHSSDTCTLADTTSEKAIPNQLTVECVASRSDYHNEDPALRGTFDTPRTETYEWNGTAYVKQP